MKIILIRGGSWYCNAAYATVAYRSDNDPFYQSINFGFRVVRP
jgi:formylglycine-generating enzyme required for sulfatase activity